MRPIDADALLEKMVGITDGWLMPPKDWKWYENSVKNAPTVGDWISVKDKLPDSGVYLARTADGVYKILEYIGDIWSTNESGKCVEYDVTHWMPLPKQPNVGKMSDKKKVISGLKCMANENTGCYSECPYYTERTTSSCFRAMARDALTLLQEQEPLIIRKENVSGVAKCPECGMVWAMGYPEKMRFCTGCGKMVKWSD